MKSTSKHIASGKVPASLASVLGLVAVWGIVGANLPSKDELWSAQSPARNARTPVAPELDLTIPGVPATNPADASHSDEASQSMGSARSRVSSTTGGFSVPSEVRARQIVEVKCDAEVQQYCSDSLTEEVRRQCVVQRMNRLPLPCQQIMRQRMVRWKEAEGYKASCAEDVRRVCQGVEPGDGRMLTCLQEHAQDLSESCYQSLPKGHLLLRN